MPSVVAEGITAQQLGETTAQWVQRVTRETAMSALREEVARGFDSEPVVVTDGVPRRDPDLVRPYGRIEWIARQNMADIVLWALNELWKRSPILTRRYINSHTVMVNNVSVGANMAAALRATKPGDRVQIVNPQPYAKKIEGRAASRKRGISGQRGQSRQAPQGVYRVVHRLAVQRYGRSVFVDFKYVKLDTGAKVWSRQGSRRVQRDAVYPALQFFIKPVTIH